MTAITVVFCGVLGLLIGSFLNVVIWRVPRGESIVRPPSHCPCCDDADRAARQRPGRLLAAAAGPLPDLRRADLGPLPARRAADRRRCSPPRALRFGPMRSCRRTSTSAPWAWRWPSSTSTSSGCRTCSPCRPTPWASCCSAWPRPVHQHGRPAPRGPRRAGAVRLLLHRASSPPRGMGFGDVKLAGRPRALPGLAGLGAGRRGCFAAFAVGALVGIGLILFAGGGRKTKVPFGPFMLPARFSASWPAHLASAYTSAHLGLTGSTGRHPTGPHPLASASVRRVAQRRDAFAQATPSPTEIRP